MKNPAVWIGTADPTADQMLLMLQMVRIIDRPGGAYDRIHSSVSTAAGPRQLGNRHVLRQADGRWRAPHAIPASPHR